MTKFKESMCTYWITIDRYDTDMVHMYIYHTDQHRWWYFANTYIEAVKQMLSEEDLGFLKREGEIYLTGFFERTY